MAPVSATGAGVPRQRIDDPTLIALLARLAKFEPSSPDISCNESANNTLADGDVNMTEINSSNRSRQQSRQQYPLDIDGLVGELDQFVWRFQEQADLYEWVKPLNAIDAALRYLLDTHPTLLLLPRTKSPSNTNNDDAKNKEWWTHSPHALQTSSQQPPTTASQQHAISHIIILLKFLSTLLSHSTNKAVFNSLPELTDLLSSSDDNIAACALEALSSLAVPPQLHRQQGPEMTQHSSALHHQSSNSAVNSRLMTLAKGWGTKGCGLGLLDCVEMDDRLECSEEEGNAELPPNHPSNFVYAGEVSFECYARPADDVSSRVLNMDSTSGELVSLRISHDAMFEPSGNTMSDETSSKRRKMDSSLPTSSRQLKSTSQLYLESLAKIKLENPNVDLSAHQQFNLLSSIRLARAFHSSTTRLSAMEQRLRVLVIVIFSHPSQEIVSAYFLAQPELCGELVDLLRPTVSSGSISSAVIDEDIKEGDRTITRPNSILALGDSPVVPYTLRSLAIEVMTALVARRDASGSLSTLARQINVLAELGVGKGQYLGLLPALIRHSLAVLNSFLLESSEGEGETAEVPVKGIEEEKKESERDIGLELGLAFLRATKPPPLPRQEREERSLEFIDSVLTLTSAVVSVPSGTSSLTDCGIIPALISTVALDGRTAHKSHFSTDGKDGSTYADSMLKFIAAQAIQILEGAIVTHGNALSAFHELNGVDILVKRLNAEVTRIQEQKFKTPRESEDRNEFKTPHEDEDAMMQDAELSTSQSVRIGGARRVLLFSSINCLTVVYHSHESPNAPNQAPSAGEQVRRPEMMNVLTEVFDNVSSYGGVLCSLLSTFVSSVMNSDPQVVHYVHRSGLAKSLLSMLLGRSREMKTVLGDDVASWGEPVLEPQADLIQSIPSVIAALSLTEAGAKNIKTADPFPALFAVFCSPRYAMPNSRCVLAEMAAIVGTGLDEIMRHTPSLKDLVAKSIVKMLRRIVYLGQQLNTKETSADADELECEKERTYLMQYVYNVTQMLEQILHNEDHACTFLKANERQ